MLFLYVTIIIVILNGAALYLNSAKASNMWKTRYPNLQIVKSHWSDKALNFTKYFVMSICPILNIVLLWTMIFDSDEICEKIVWDMYLKAKHTEQAGEDVE